MTLTFGRKSLNFTVRKSAAASLGPKSSGAVSCQVERPYDFIICMFGVLKLGPGIVHTCQFSHSVMSDSLRLHGLQHAKPPYPLTTPGVYPNSCLWSWWCHQAISSSVVPFSSCLQSFPASGSFPMSQLFELGGQSIGVSASTSVLPMNTQDWSPLGWTGWIALNPRDSRESSPTPQFKSISSSAYMSEVLKNVLNSYCWPLAANFTFKHF